MIGEGYSWEEIDRLENIDDDLIPSKSLSLQWRGWRKPSSPGTEDVTPATSHSVFVVEREEAAVAARAAITGKVFEQAENIAEAIVEQTPTDNISTDEAYARLLHSRSVMVMELAKRIAANKKILLPVDNAPMTPAGILKAINNAKPPYSLTELAVRVVAKHIPFEAVERFNPPVPEDLQLRVAFRSFPNDTEDIRLYACLANGSGDEFSRGEVLAKSHSAVQMCLQIGFYLTASVVTTPDTLVRVSVTFDRQKIVSCECECDKPTPWCHHVVAVCLYRILKPDQIKLRAPISDSLHRLSREQLMKLTQYLIADLPHPMLTRAQELIDDLTLDKNNKINRIQGAPDPTAGSSSTTIPLWNVNLTKLRDCVREIIENNLAIPRPMVLCDINHLNSSPPPTSAEYSALLRPLRAKDPESLWNLLAMAREMIGRRDRNAVNVMFVLTDEILRNPQLLLWWFTVNVSNARGHHSLTYNSCNLPLDANSANGTGNSRHTQVTRDLETLGITSPRSNNNNNNNNSNSNSNNIAMLNTNALCDEVINLWRVIASDPATDPCWALALFQQFAEYHLKVLKKVSDMRRVVLDPYIASVSGSITYMTPTDDLRGHSSQSYSHQPMVYPMKSSSDAQAFSGFKPAMLACTLDWEMEYHRPENVGAGTKADFPVAESVSYEISPERRAWRLRATEITVEFAPQLEHFELTPIEELAAISPYDPTFRFVNSYLRELHIQPENIRRHQHRRNTQRVADLEAATKLGSKVLATLRPSLPPYDFDEDEKENQKVDGEKDEGEENAKKKNKGVIQLVIKERPLTTNPHIYMAAKLTQHLTDDEKTLLRAETLYAHNYMDEAIELAVQLAQKLLSKPPVFVHENNCSTSSVSTEANNNYGLRKMGGYNPSKRGTRPRLNHELHKISMNASATLTKTAFLINVLLERKTSHFLAFQLGLFALEMIRPPASTKTLEVKMDNQEAELVTALKHIPLTNLMLDILREKARQLIMGKIAIRGECLLPVYLASFIFDALVLSFRVRDGQLENKMRWGHPQHCTLNDDVSQYSTDERLALEAATRAIALNVKLAEADHPILCEGQRRQRGELALMLMVTFKDDIDAMEIILDALLDRGVHCVFKHSGAKYFTIEPYSKLNNRSNKDTSSSYSPQESVEEESYNGGGGGCQQPNVNQDNPSTSGTQAKTSNNMPGSPPRVDINGSGGISAVNTNNSSETCCKTRSSSSSSSGSCYESLSSDTSNNENLATKEQPLQHPLQESRGGLSTTQPTKTSPNYQQNTNGYYASNSSNQFYSRGQQAVPTGNVIRNSASVCPESQAFNTHSRNGYVPPYGHVPRQGRMRGFHKRNHHPTLPNYPSESAAHYMSELAKAVLGKAGGSSTSTHFVNDPENENNAYEPPHRNLHLASLYIALYALGLHNRVTMNWLQRTYSTLVLFIEVQALEIGHEAISMLTAVWEGHLTPNEAANLADQASSHECPKMLKAAAELAFSCLPYAAALQESTLQGVLRQCKKLNDEMLEQALDAVEHAALSGGLDDEMIFNIARYWFEIYERERNRRLGRVGIFKSLSEIAMEENAVWSDACRRRLQQNNSQGRNPQVSARIVPVVAPARLPTPPPRQLIAMPDLNFAPHPVRMENEAFVKYSSDEYLSFFAVDKTADWQNLLRNGIVVTQDPVVFAKREQFFRNRHIQELQAVEQYNREMDRRRRQGVVVPTFQQIFQTQQLSQWFPNNQQHQPNFQPQYQLQLQQQQFQPQQQQFQPQPQQQQQPQFQPQQQQFQPQMQQPWFQDAQQQQQQQFQPQQQQQWPQLPQHDLQQDQSFNERQQQQQHQLEDSNNTLAEPQLSAQSSVNPMMTEREQNLVQNAFRVGMLGMRASAMNHFRPSLQKYQRNLTLKDDIKWLLNVARMLGVANMREFLEIITATVHDDAEMLYEVAQLACQFFNGIVGNSGCDALSTLIRKCQGLCYENLRAEILMRNGTEGRLMSTIIDRIISLVFVAQDAFLLSPNGSQIFKASLDQLRTFMRNDLWTTINNALHNRSMSNHTNNGKQGSPPKDRQL